MPNEITKQDGSNLATTPREQRIAELKSEAGALSRQSLQEAVAPRLKEQAAAEVVQRVTAQIGHHPQYGHLAAMAAASDARDAVREVDGYGETIYEEGAEIVNPDGSHTQIGGRAIGTRSVPSNLTVAPREALEQLYVDQRSEGLRELEGALGRAGLKIDRSRVILEKLETEDAARARRNAGMQD